MCSLHCQTNGCNETGAAKCDECDAGYGLNSAGACDGKTYNNMNSVFATNYNVRPYFFTESVCVFVFKIVSWIGWHLIGMSGTRSRIYKIILAMWHWMQSHCFWWYFWWAVIIIYKTPTLIGFAKECCLICKVHTTIFLRICLSSLPNYCVKCNNWNWGISFQLVLHTVQPTDVTALVLADVILVT